MVLRAFIILHIFTITVIGYQCVYCKYINTLDKTQIYIKRSVVVLLFGGGGAVFIAASAKLTELLQSTL